ncbi:hypothetical protein BRC81_07270 [Halobacteriales archaeon QS_1_68_20]|nr:MAG: hypothetical protein BRC81_07270 [Halobacteriales archaeon QS_1_68_20]
MLDAGGEVRERHEVEYRRPGVVTYPPTASAVTHDGLLLTAVRRTVMAFDPPDWEPSTDDGETALVPGFGLGAAGLALGGSATWAARRRNQT